MLFNQDGSVRTRIAIRPGAQRAFGPADATGGGKDASPSFRLRVLIVEDESVVAMQLEDTVQDLGHVVATVASHAAAVDATEGSRPDLVLMDINLGRGGNGVEAALELQRRFDVPSIFLSAYLSSPGVREQVQAAEPLGLVTKPYTVRHIEAALKQAAERIKPGRN